MHNLTLNPDLLARRHGTQIPAVQVPTHVSRVPEALFGACRQRRRGADVEDECDGAAMKGAGHWLYKTLEDMDTGKVIAKTYYCTCPEERPWKTPSLNRLGSPLSAHTLQIPAL
jgi:hypothetical protein